MRRASPKLSDVICCFRSSVVIVAVVVWFSLTAMVERMVWLLVS